MSTACLRSLVKTAGPEQDRNALLSGYRVVLYADNEFIDILQSCTSCHACYVTTCESIENASGTQIPEADFYWCKVGYFWEPIAISGPVDICELGERFLELHHCFSTQTEF